MKKYLIPLFACCLLCGRAMADKNTDEKEMNRFITELMGRITLKAGESRNVEFHITAEKLKFYNYNLDYVLEPGEFEIMIGPNSGEVKSVRITLSSEPEQ